MTKPHLCPFTCPRCGYEVGIASRMRIHFAKKRPCPVTVCSIELTEEIKNIVLRDRKYRPIQEVKEAKEETPVQQNIVQNIGTVNNNFNINVLDKLLPLDYLFEGYAKKTNKQIETIEEFITRCVKKKGWLGSIGQEGQSPHPVVKLEDYATLLDGSWLPTDKNKLPCIISEMPTVKEEEDEKEDTDMFVSKGDNRYESKDEKETMKLIIQCAQQIFFKEYESYLLDVIQKYPDDHPDNIFSIRAYNLLKDYYTILIAVDLEPMLDRNMSAWSDATKVSSLNKHKMCQSILNALQNKSKHNTKHMFNEIKKFVMRENLIGY
jgi:hypothetical protein